MQQIARPGTIELSGLLAVALIWGSAFPAIKVAVVDFGTFWTAAIRVFVGFLALMPFIAIRRHELSALTGNWTTMVLIALLNMVIPFILISWSMNHIPAGIGSLLLGTTPFIAMVMGHFLTQDERITGMKLVSVAFALAGIVVLVGPDVFGGVGATSALAQLAIVLAGICYVSAGFIMRRIDIPPVAFTGAALGLGSMMLIGISLVISELPETTPSLNALTAILWLGMFPTGLAYVLRYILVKRVGVSTFAVAMNTVPIFGIILAALLLGEVIELRMIIALAMVLSGLAIARLAVPKQA